MDTTYIRHLLRSAATGSILLLSVTPAEAGRMFPDEPSRPHVHAGDMPNWGFNQTCWQRFPPLPPCSGNGSCYQNGMQGAVEYSQQENANIYTPQNSMMMPGQSFSTLPGTVSPSNVPGPRYSQEPVYSQPGILPNVPMQASEGPLITVPPVPSSGPLPPPGSSYSEPLQQFQAIPSAPTPLPPLPAPPALMQPGAVPGIPGQTSFAPQQLILSADGRLSVASSRGTQAIQGSPSARYGNRSQLILPQQPSVVAPPMAMPQMQFSNVSGSSVNSRPSSRYGQSSSQELNVQPVSQSRPVMQSSNYRTGTPDVRVQSAPQMNLEPLRATPRPALYR